MKAQQVNENFFSKKRKPEKGDTVKIKTLEGEPRGEVYDITGYNNRSYWVDLGAFGKLEFSHFELDIVNEGVKDVLKPKSPEEVKSIRDNLLTHIENGDVNIGNLSVDEVDHENKKITLSQEWDRSTSETMLFFDYDRIGKRSDFYFEIKIVIDLNNGTISGTGNVTHEDVDGWSLDYAAEPATFNDILDIEELVDELAGSIEYGNTFEHSLRKYLGPPDDEKEEDYDTICAFCGEEFTTYEGADDICDDCSDDDDED